jgi:hypothetical protein
VLVGVDDIPSRWFTQEQEPLWLGVAGTSHFSAMVSEHVPGGVCAGCVHPRNESEAAVDGSTEIPTVSFTSLAAGALLAYRLLANVTRVFPQPPEWLWTFDLHGAFALTPMGMAANRECPVGCLASQQLAA